MKAAVTPHAGDNAERPAGQVGGDLDAAGFGGEFEQHQVAAADGQRVEKRAPPVAVVDELALQAQAEHQREGADEQEQGAHGSGLKASSQARAARRARG